MDAPSWKEDPKAWRRWYSQQPRAREAARASRAKYDKTHARRHDFGSRAIKHKPLEQVIQNWSK